MKGPQLGMIGKALCKVRQGRGRKGPRKSKAECKECSRQGPCESKALDKTKARLISK
jgi:hypothetical protein